MLMGSSQHLAITQHQLERLVAAFKCLDGSRILLTGGSGFVGKCMLEAAKIAQQKSAIKIEIVIPTRRLSSHHVQMAINIGCPNVTWIEGDLLSEVFDLGIIDKIIHAATPASAKLNAENPVEMLRINVEAMRSVLSYSVADTPFLFTSSGAVYGSQPQTVSHIEEGESEPRPPTEQLNAYALGKLRAEQLVRDAGIRGECSPIITRLFTFGGEHLPRDTHFAIGNFIQSALDHKPIAIQCDGRTRRSYLYGLDMATWLWSALACVSGQEIPLHIGSEHSVSIFELAQTVAAVSSEVLRYAPEITVRKEVNSSEAIHQYVPANSGTRESLQVSEWTSLEEIIRRTIVHATS